MKPWGPRGTLGDMAGASMKSRKTSVRNHQREWVWDLQLGLGFGGGRGCSASTSGEPRGGNHSGFFSFLRKKSQFALVKKPISRPSKPHSVGRWGQPRVPANRGLASLFWDSWGSSLGHGRGGGGKPCP